MENEAAPVELEIDGVLDLHMFHPSDVKHLVPDYIDLCLEKEIFRVRIIHGKGTGNLRRTVHAILGRITSVRSFETAPENAGGWGATLVTLRKN